MIHITAKSNLIDEDGIDYIESKTGSTCGKIGSTTALEDPGFDPGLL